MFKNKYLLRLDDACPTMNTIKWQRMNDLLDHYGVRPMVGVIPHNEDPKQKVSPPDELFWHKVRIWQNNGWAIALHGYNHCYTCNGGMVGLNPMWRRSEFAGLSLKDQQEKVRKGVAIMREHGINPRYFFAPSHTFDKNTLTALREESDIRCISDTIGFYPYIKDDFYFIPQITGHCVKIPFNGIYTFCFHPNTMSDEAFKALDHFIKMNISSFISFEEIALSQYGEKRMADKFLSWLFFTYRKLKGLQ